MFKKLFKKKQTEQEKQIALQINDMKLYLENNYKDLAIQGRKDAISLLENTYEAGQISECTYKHYKEILDKYTEEMKEYNHQQFYRT